MLGRRVVRSAALQIELIQVAQAFRLILQALFLRLLLQRLLSLWRPGFVYVRDLVLAVCALPLQLVLALCLIIQRIRLDNAVLCVVARMHGVCFPGGLQVCDISLRARLLELGLVLLVQLGLDQLYRVYHALLIQINRINLEMILP